MGTYCNIYFLRPVYSSRFGRKTAAVIAGTAGAVLGITKSFATSFWFYIVLEGLEAAIGDALSPMFMLSKSPNTFAKGNFHLYVFPNYFIFYNSRYRNSRKEVSSVVPDGPLELLYYRSDHHAFHRVGVPLLATLPPHHLYADAAHPHLLVLPRREHPVVVQQGQATESHTAHTEDSQEKRGRDRQGYVEQDGVHRRGNQVRHQ